MESGMEKYTSEDMVNKPPHYRFGGYELLEGDSYTIYGRVTPREMDGFLRGILYGYDQGKK